MSAVAAVLLVAFWLWNFFERKLSKAYSARVKPFMPAKTPTFTTEDVSIVLATIHPDPDFVRCLDSWLDNKPGEIIIVTVARDVPAIENMVLEVKHSHEKIQILTVDQANHRNQQICGIKAATGKVLAMVDDDTFCGPDVLTWRIAPLEDPAVAGVTGLHSADFPPERIHPSVGTAWEALSARGLDGFNGTAQTRFGADGAVWLLLGCSQVLRAEVVKDDNFLNDLRTQIFRGSPVMAGGDTWMTRLLMERGHKLAFQCAPEGMVYTSPKIDSGYVAQLVRWQRTTYVNFSSMVLDRPGFFALRREYPYMACKMVERLLRLIIAPLHFLIWLRVLYTEPALGILVGLWYMDSYRAGYEDFSSKFPWLRRHIRALFVMDIFGWFFLEVWVLCTLASENWVHKNGESSLGSIDAAIDGGVKDDEE